MRNSNDSQKLSVNAKYQAERKSAQRESPMHGIYAFANAGS
jgi:hypothetical protein